MKNKLILINKKPTRLIEALSILLADTYTLYLKTQNYHWNVIGPQFNTLHLLFEGQYNALAAATDLIAERIRALNARAPATFSEFLKMSQLNEGDSHLNADKMLLDLYKDHDAITKSIVKTFEVAKEVNDEATLELLIERKTEHDKIAWMLRSTLGTI